MVAEKYSFSNSSNSKQFLTLMLEMHSANQEDPIMLANIIKHLCHTFGRISKVSNYLNKIKPFSLSIFSIICLM